MFPGGQAERKASQSDIHHLAGPNVQRNDTERVAGWPTKATHRGRQRSPNLPRRPRVPTRLSPGGAPVPFSGGPSRTPRNGNSRTVPGRARAWEQLKQTNPREPRWLERSSPAPARRSKHPRPRPRTARRLHRYGHLRRHACLHRSAPELPFARAAAAANGFRSQIFARPILASAGLRFLENPSRSHSSCPTTVRRRFLPSGCFRPRQPGWLPWSDARGALSPLIAQTVLKLKLMFESPQSQTLEDLETCNLKTLMSPETWMSALVSASLNRSSEGI